MRIRTFEARDVGPACRITNHFIEHTAVHFGASPISEAEFAAAWHAGLDTHPWLAAEIDADDGQTSFVGYAKAGPWRARDAYARTAEVSIYLDPAHVGRGGGTALYAELLARLRSAGFHVAVAGATLPNDASARLHERFGFEYVGTFRQVGRKFDRWHDVGWWQLVLD